MTVTNSFVFRFADVEVRESEFSVIKSGEVLAVEPKAFRVLLFLVRNPQRVVTKEELLGAVWGETAVTENSLTRSILKLRRVLDDDAREPKYIETVATVGYRLICSVHASEEIVGHLEASRNGASAAARVPAGQAEQHDTHTEIALDAGRNDRPQAEILPKIRRSPAARSRLLWIGAAFLVLFALVAAIRYVRGPLPQPRITSYTQLTHDNRRKGLFAADRSRLYLTFYPEVQWVGQLSASGGPIVPIPTTFPDPWVIDASPDGTKLLMLSSDQFGPDNKRGGLWIVDPVGSVQHQLASGPIITAAWSPDGKSVVYTRSNGDIQIIAADGTGDHRIATTSFDSSNGMMDRISWSPDGSRIRVDKNDRIYEIAPDGSNLHPFLPDWRPGSMMCCGRWTADGSFFLFLEWQSPSPGNPLFAPSQIWMLDERRSLLRRTSSEPIQLTSGPTRWGGPIASADGRRIYARGVVLNGQLERANLRTHQLEPLFGGISAEFVDFSPDRSSVVYVTFPEGILWRANSDGSDPTQLTSPPFYPTQTRWSPDGTEILAYARDAKGLDRAYLISPLGGTPRPLFADNPDEQVNPCWSPDGKKIVMSWFYSSGKEPLSEIRIYDLATHELTTVPGSKDLDSPRWSPDGQWLSGVNIYSTELFVFNFRTQRWTSVEKGNNDYPVWSHHGGYLYFLHGVVNTGIFRVKPTGGAAERVIDLKGFRFISYYNGWVGLDPDDAPMVLRDVGSDDIYALNLEWK
jgi:DNA-binding winged helix-turn-helix (wHTH) protein/Tol biopolymer transport system component